MKLNEIANTAKPYPLAHTIFQMFKKEFNLKKHQIDKLSLPAPVKRAEWKLYIPVGDAEMQNYTIERINHFMLSEIKPLVDNFHRAKNMQEVEGYHWNLEKYMEIIPQSPEVVALGGPAASIAIERVLVGVSPQTYSEHQGGVSLRVIIVGRYTKIVQQNKE